MNNEYNLKRQKEVFGFTEEDIKNDIQRDSVINTYVIAGIGLIFLAILAAVLTSNFI